MPTIATCGRWLAIAFFTKDSMLDARRLLRRATDLDPTYAAARVARQRTKKGRANVSISIWRRCTASHWAGCFLWPTVGTYLIAAKASTCSRKSGLDNCGARTVLLS